ncbi:MAG: hypothetical protein WHV66_14520 [Anaerolineales bacterium]
MCSRAAPPVTSASSSKVIAAGLDSQNLIYFCAFARLKDLLGERPLALDREFSYLELLPNLVAEGGNFVIRLNLGAQPLKFGMRMERRWFLPSRVAKP